jgi:uncharacterized protein
MSEMLPLELIAEVKSHYELDWNGAHGIAHWSRVLDNGLRIAEVTGANVRVIQLFALFHDCQRANEHHDNDHGKRGASLIFKLKHDIPFKDFLEYHQFLQACNLHTDAMTHRDITVQTCFDADRLDLARVRIRPDPKLLCTDAARNLISWATRNATLNFIPDNILGRSL